jgi:SAM-dependent methyltransferase
MGEQASIGTNPSRRTFDRDKLLAADIAIPQARLSQELVHFISRYLRDQPHGTPRAPDLLDSLTMFAPMHGELGPDGRLPDPCRCLIEGYAAPNNALDLRNYLAAAGLSDVDILAIDLYDLTATYTRIGREIPAMRYRMADARNLRGVVMDASIDLVIQDFLVNCVHPSDVPTLFREARRVLSPAGLALISFTDDRCMEDVELVDADGDNQLADVQKSLVACHASDQRELILGQRVKIPGCGSWAFATRPHGRLEFFSPLAQTLAAIQCSGLEIVARSVSCGLDDHGLHCTRHRCILRRGVEEATLQ